MEKYQFTRVRVTSWDCFGYPEMPWTPVSVCRVWENLATGLQTPTQSEKVVIPGEEPTTPRGGGGDQGNTLPGTPRDILTLWYWGGSMRALNWLRETHASQTLLG